jgi:NAD/NADP transhydrogenase alpha subunit
MTNLLSRRAILAAWLETAAMPTLTAVAVGASSGLSMGGATGWLFAIITSLTGTTLGVVLAERERRDTRRQATRLGANQP